MEGRKVIKLTLAVVGIAIIIGYSYFVLDDFVRGPRIIIESPISGYSTTTTAIVIVGHTIHTNNLLINGYQTPVDLAGNFTSHLILAPGYNIIKITAKDNYKREVEEMIEINLITEPLTIDPGAGTTTATSTGASTLLTL